MVCRYPVDTYEELTRFTDARRCSLSLANVGPTMTSFFAPSGLHRHLIKDLADATHLCCCPNERAALMLVLQGPRQSHTAAANGRCDFRLCSGSHQFLVDLSQKSPVRDLIAKSHSNSSTKIVNETR